MNDTLTVTSPDGGPYRASTPTDRCSNDPARLPVLSWIMCRIGRRSFQREESERARRVTRIQTLINEYFPPNNHPHKIFLTRILNHLKPSDTVLEIGCGRAASELLKLKGLARELIGIDLAEFVVADPAVKLLNVDVTDMRIIASDSIDLAYSRSVMEHIEDVEAAYAEISRVLRPAGRYIFLTPSAWDFASAIAHVVPNRFHPGIVRMTEGRDERDVFPTYYRSNTFRKISRIAGSTGLSIEHFEYLGQYPSYFRFSPALFSMGCRYEKFLERHPRLHFLRGWILCALAKDQSIT